MRLLFAKSTVSVPVLVILSALCLPGCSRVTSPKNQPSSVAQRQIPPDPCDVQPPGDISLHLTLRNGQTVFHQGEIIPLIATYSAQTKKKYSVWGGNAVGTPVFGDGELYCLTPNVGLIENVFEGAMLGNGGGFSVGLGEGDPATEPSAFDLELNDPRSVFPSVRSLPAGKYSLRLVSRRVTSAVKDCFVQPPQERTPVVSNWVEFEVKADPQWQTARFAENSKILDSSTSPLWRKIEAIHKLRFLDTEASTRELADHFSASDRPEDWDIVFALFGSSHRVAAIQEMKAALTDPHHPITLDFAKVLAALEMQVDPRFRVPAGDQMGKDALAKTIDANRAEFDHRVQEYLKLAASVNRVSGR
jgi:hypothetical protein